MKPGIYNMPFAEYLAAPGVSASQIKLASANLAAWKRRYIDNVDDDGDKKHFVVGRALHTLVLEPHLFQEQFLQMPVINRRTNAGKAEYEEFMAGAGDRGVLAADDWDMVNGMAASIKSHETAGKIFNHSTGQAEKSVFAEIEGHQMKCRFDWLFSDIIFDIKTCQDASLQGFQRAIANLKYHIQAAIYIDVLRLFFENVEQFVFVAVEKKPPYFVAVYPLADRAVEVGRSEYREALDRMKWAQEQGTFPGYNDDTYLEIDLPPWAYGYERNFETV